MAEKVSMRRLAQLAGVSVATVSRVLNNKPGVSDATRLRVVEMMEQYDYTPSVISNHGQTIGIVVFPETDIFLADFFPELFHGISEETFRREHYLTLLRLAKEKLNERDLGHRMRTLGVCGYLVVGTFLTPRDVANLNGIDVPYVIVGGASIPKNANWVGTDHVSAGREITRYVLSMGHRRIAVVGWPQDRPSTQDHLKGILQELSAADIPLHTGEVIPPQESACRGLLNADREDGRPAIITLSHNDGLFVSRVVSRLGLKIPDDVSLVTFGDYRSGKWAEIKLTTASIPTDQVGATAISLLLDLVAGRIDRPIRHEFSSQLTIRGSVKRLRQNRAGTTVAPVEA